MPSQGRNLYCYKKIKKELKNMKVSTKIIFLHFGRTKNKSEDALKNFLFLDIFWHKKSYNH